MRARPYKYALKGGEKCSAGSGLCTDLRAARGLTLKRQHGYEAGYLAYRLLRSSHPVHRTLGSCQVRHDRQRQTYVEQSHHLAAARMADTEKKASPIEKVR